MMNYGSARFVKQLEKFTGEARLYRLSPPYEDNAFVVVSAAVVMFSGPETYIFAANEDGEVQDWGELPGSFRGGLDHAEALNGLGYLVAP